MKPTVSVKRTSRRLGSFFFFQAEDGIRDRNVTGVQTRALPIYKVREVHLMQWDDPDVVVDISEVMDLKLKALACHQSQFKDFAGVEERVCERAAELDQKSVV